MEEVGPIPESLRPVLARNLELVRERVAEAALRAQRDPDSVRIIVVTKTVAAEVVALLPELGVREIGENRVQEAASKLTALSHLDLRWHMIGHLQTNKVRKALQIFHRVHSVDRPSVLEALSAEGVRREREVDCLLQVNVSEEESKGGYSMSDVEAVLDHARSLPGLRVTGLMAIPAPVDDPEESRSAFRALRELRDRVRSDADDLPDLSMGMTQDYGVAVEEGATLVRVGSAVFRGVPKSLYGRAADAAAGAA